MKKIEIVTNVVNGRLKRNRSRITDAIKSFEGKTISITLKLNRKQRSNNQNNYYWGVIVMIWQNILKEEWGDQYSKEETHEFLKYNCNYIEKVNTDTGEVIRMSKSTIDNSTSEQEEFHTNCRNLAFEMFNTEIPLPSEQIKIEL